jgi:hypothetical protein
MFSNFFLYIYSFYCANFKMSGKELDDMTLEKIIKLILQDVLCTVFIVVKLFHQGAIEVTQRSTCHDIVYQWQ